MKYHSEFKCDIHKDDFDCPDKIIYSTKKNKEFGIIIHDGGTSFIKIKFCPWCGKKLKNKSNV
ncbi:DUF6980 family protein [Flavobacterium croceum]|nr:hypothetical protein [Flavobacterium croceum]